MWMILFIVAILCFIVFSQLHKRSEGSFGSELIGTLIGPFLTSIILFFLFVKLYGWSYYSLMMLFPMIIPSIVYRGEMIREIRYRRLYAKNEKAVINCIHAVFDDFGLADERMNCQYVFSFHSIDSKNKNAIQVHIEIHPGEEVMDVIYGHKTQLQDRIRDLMLNHFAKARVLVHYPFSYKSQKS